MIQPRTARAFLLVMFVMIMTGCGREVEPPYVGAFYLQAGELVEIPQSSQYPFAVGSTDPELDDLAVIYVKYPLPSIENLVLQRIPGTDRIPATIDIKDNLVYELKPRSKLADGGYCLVVADATKSVESLTRWCFRIGDRAIAEATTALPAAAVPTAVAVPQAENAPHWRLLAYDLSQAPGDPGWIDYKARLAYQALVPLVQGRLKVGGGYVLTAEGNQYPAVITRVDANEPGPPRYSPQLGISTLIDHELTVYEPGIPVGHVPGVTVHGRPGYRRIDMFWLSFRVPDSLTPISLHFPGFEPIDLDSLPARPAVVSGDYSPNYVPGDPIQITDAVTMRLGNPHRYQRQYDGMQVLAFDVELTNNDVTADRQAAFIVSMVDNNGVLYYSPSISCSESGLHYSGIGSGSFSTRLGPGQTQKGAFCVLGWDLAQSAGPFVVIVTGGERYPDPKPSVHTFILDIDPETGSITVSEPGVLAQDALEQSDVAAGGEDLPTCDRSKISPGRIAVVEWWEGCTLYLVDADGSSMARITSLEAQACLPSWSPDGERVAFVLRTIAGPYSDLYVMRTDGTGLQRVAQYVEGVHGVDWSPDGRQLVLSAESDGNREIYVMDADGENRRNLTQNRAEEDEPRWSPDGRSILFTSNRSSGDNLYVMDFDGSNLRRLTQGLSHVWGGDWSPDGRQISFMLNLDGDADAFVMDADGSMRKEVTQNKIDDSLGPWSPDGHYLVFHSFQGYVSDLSIVNADGSDPRRLFHGDGLVSNMSWSPDGRYIAFSWQPGDISNRQSESDIYVGSADGSNLCRVMHRERLTEVEWLP